MNWIEFKIKRIYKKLRTENFFLELNFEENMWVLETRIENRRKIKHWVFKIEQFSKNVEFGKIPEN
jgi:hypothetical protein